MFLAGVSDVRGQKTADKLTEKAKKAKEALKSLVTVEFEDVPLKEAVAELKEKQELTKVINDKCTKLAEQIKYLDSEEEILALL